MRYIGYAAYNKGEELAMNNTPIKNEMLQDFEDLKKAYKAFFDKWIDRAKKYKDPVRSDWLSYKGEAILYCLDYNIASVGNDIEILGDHINQFVKE